MKDLIRSLCLAFGVALLLGRPALADDAARHFDIPAADAAVSLQRFSEQSGEQIAYPVDAVRGVTTNAVAGDYPARDALERLVAGTDLYVVQDAASGALSVKRRSAAALPAKDPAPAPSAPAGEASDDQTVVLNRYVVTGSNIPTAADRSDVPVTVLGRRELDETGDNANLLDLMRKRVPAFAGRSNVGNANATNTNQNTAGGSQIQLRNMETLVLINGRRMAVSGANALNGGKNFVDVNQIPTAAIDRIEVLTDGASAIYGSDAVGGVINIILKTDYEGLEIGGRYAESPNAGHYSEKSGYLVAGEGRNGVNLTVTGSWSHTDPLWQSSRPFIANNFQAKANFPGVVGSAASGYFVLQPTVATPSKGNAVGAAATATSLATLAGSPYQPAIATTPVFNLAPYQTILLRDDQKAATASLTVDIVPKVLTAFGDYLMTNTKTFQQSNNFLSNISTGNTVAAGTPYNPVAGAVANVAVGSLDLPEQMFNHARGDRGTAGLRGQIGDRWNWEVGGVYSQEKLTQDIANVLFKPNLAAAIAGGYNSAGTATVGGTYSKIISINGYPGVTNYVYEPALDPFAQFGRDPASLANVYGTEVIQATSQLKGVDAKIVGSPLDLPAGKLEVAVGGATRKESLTSAPDPNGYFANQNWLGGTSFDPFSHSRTINSVYAETRVPIAGPSWHVPGLYALDLALAGRIENYTATGTSSVPKVGLRWQPIDDQITVRFSYSKAFAAPDLWHEYGPQSAAPTSSATFFSSNLGISDPRLNQSFAYYSGNGNNPALQPNRAWSRSFGVAVSPHAVPGLTFSADYVNIYEKGIPGGIGANNIVSSVNALGSASPYFGAIAVGGIPGTPGATQAPLTSPNGLYNLLVGGTYQGNLYILDHFINLGGVHEEAVDLNPQYQFKTASAGTFTIGTTGTYLAHFLVANLPTLPFYEFAGYSTNTQTEAGSFPHWSFYSTAEWQLHGWEATLGNTYLSSMTDVGAVTNGGTYAPANYLSNHPAVSVASYTAWDLQLGYTFSRDAAGHLWSWLKGVRVAVGVNNVFNRYGPYAGLSQAAANNNNNNDTSTYSPIGRLLYTTVSVKF